MRSCANLSRRARTSYTREANQTPWGSAPNPGIFLGIAGSSNVCDAVDQPYEKWPTEMADQSHTRFSVPDKAIPWRGCIPAEPASASPCNTKLHKNLEVTNVFNNFAAEKANILIDASTLATLNALRLKLVCSPEGAKGVPPLQSSAGVTLPCNPRSGSDPLPDNPPPGGIPGTP